MSVFASSDFRGHERVVFVHDSATGLHAIIAIHSTTRGPALGGCRMWDYETEEAGLRDVLRLSRGMTYKAALVNVDIGGGKCVILGRNTTKTPELMRAMGREIDKLNGMYITGPDVGTGVEDMTTIHEATDYVIGVAKDHGGYGDPSPSTALGVLMGIKAGLMHDRKSADLEGVSVAVQGLGHVGMNLCQLLHAEGVRLVVSDINHDRTEVAEKELGATVTGIGDIHRSEVDVYAPCALGAGLNDETIPEIQARVISGGANNQLDRDEHGDMLRDRGIIYLPDYVANGGGLVQVAAEWFKEPAEVYEPKINDIYHTCLEILQRADDEDISTNVASDRIAEERISSAKPDPAVME